MNNIPNIPVLNFMISVTFSILCILIGIAMIVLVTVGFILVLKYMIKDIKNESK